MELPEKITSVMKNLNSIILELKIKSALNSVLLFSIIALPCFLIFSWKIASISQGLSELSFYIAASIVVVFVIIFLGYSVFYPDKLQSEEYQLRNTELKLMAQDREINSVDTIATANPATEAAFEKINLSEGETK